MVMTQHSDRERCSRVEGKQLYFQAEQLLFKNIITYKYAYNSKNNINSLKFFNVVIEFNYQAPLGVNCFSNKPKNSRELRQNRKIF